MPVRRWAVWMLMAIALAGFHVEAIAGDERPVLQLTAESSQLTSNDKCIGNLMLRELQRQAVLIAAREELGLRTRDPVLREPFGTGLANRVFTLRFDWQIWRGGKAQICLSPITTNSLADPDSASTANLAGPQDPRRGPALSRPGSPTGQWIDFPISSDPIVNYPEFAARCEAESRGDYLAALKSEMTAAGVRAIPTVWVVTGMADPRAIRLLTQFDVFSQYQALRILHAQMREQGASAERVEALVRGYSNLVQLTENQWSQAYKVFAARAMLYAQRLVVHERSSPASLYARGYAMAMTSLHAAALKDLDAADRLTDPLDRPEWEPAIRGFCHFDLASTDAAIFTGSPEYRYRPLALFLSALVSFDDYPRYRQVEAVDRALVQNPAAFVLRSYASEMLGGLTAQDEIAPQINADAAPITDHILNQLPFLTTEMLQGADLPQAVKAAVAKLSPQGDSFAGLASLRDVLISSASGSPGDAREPSLGVLAGLIEEQESAGVVRQALDSRSTGSGLAAVQAFVKKAAPILRGHPWGPYVEALSIDSATEADRLNKTLDKVHERDFGGWVNEALRELNITDAERKILSARWQTPAYLAMDNVADDFNDDNAAAKAGSADLENYLWRLRQTSPHYALLMASWLRSMPAARIVADKSLYEQAMTQVESEFSDRSTVVAAAVDWADRRADFTRSLKLLRNLDQTNPSSQVCQQIARLCRRLGYRQSAEQYLLRGLAVNSDVSQTLGLNQQRSEYLIDDGKYSDALSCLTASGDTPDARSLQLMARCYEHMGRINEAADCMTQLCVVDPLSIEQYYMWAQRVGRKDVNEIGRKAAAAFAATGDDVDRTAFMRLAQNQDRMALDIMRQHLGNSSNAKEFAQALVLAVKLNDASETSELLKRMPNDGGDDQPGFGIAINALANSDNIDAGVRAFEAWVSRQLDLENAVDWYSLAGRYLVAAGHAAQGRRYLDKALAEAPRERESYFLAWRELKRIAK